MYLENRGLERTDIMENLIIPRIDAVESRTETYHLQMTIREMFNPRTVADMTQNLVTISLLKLRTAFQEQFILTGGKGIEIVAVAPDEMGKYGTGNHSRLAFQPLHQQRHILFRVEP